MASTVEISQATNLSPEQVHDAVDQVFADLKKKYTIDGNWQSTSLFVLKGQGIIGRLEIRPGCVDVSITLSGLLASFRAIIEGQIRQQLSDKLAP